ncbi:MAG: hypothetical protein OEN49_08010, partial [Gammaproteobacteria bacterium]|nr:hypothetical protein [Gammaproteobacteria bacterium]
MNFNRSRKTNTLGWILIGILLSMPFAVHTEENARVKRTSAQPMQAIPPPAPPGSRGASPMPSGLPSKATTSATANVATPSGPGLRPGEMMFNFQDADIQAVVKTVSQITGKNFLLDPRVKGKLTIISTKAVSKKAIYQIFLASLKA